MSASVTRAKRLVGLVSVSVFLLFGSYETQPFDLWAQGTNPPPQDMPFTVSGNIIDHSPGKITISGGQNMEFDVQYDSKTEIRHRDGSPAKVTELKVGVDIQVKGLLTEAGDIIAKKIVIQAKSGKS